MAPESENNLRLEIGHVLFIDLVGYSKLLIEEQKERLGQLTEIVLATAQVREAPNEQLVRLPTGDGMALVFRNSSEEPARCALEITQALKAHPEIAVRMGVHSGPVSDVTDVSGRTNIAGAGINTAQRVMDCGDAGHILLSQRVADDLSQYREWAPRLHDLGEFGVKHGVRLHLVNLYAEQLGNPALPTKFREGIETQRTALPGGRPKRNKLVLIAPVVVAFVLICLAIVALIFAPSVLKSFSHQHTAVPLPPLPPAPAATKIPEKSIAVLPFVDMSEKKDQEYFADGLSEELMGMLSKVAELKVPARTSSFYFKGRQATIAEIAQALGVAHVLEGSVRKSGNTLRIAVELIRADNGYHVWSETYDRQLDDLFKVQDEIAGAVVKTLKVSLLEGEMPTARPAASQEAYALYLQARSLHYRGSHADNLQGITYLEQALKIDPSYAPAWFGLADALVYDYVYFGGGTYADVYVRARAAAETALRLDPTLSDAHLAMARVRGELEWNWPAADVELKRTLELDPNNVLALWTASGYALVGDRLDEALRLIEKAVARDAAGWGVYVGTGDVQIRRGQLTEAEAAYRKATELNATASGPQLWLGFVLLARGEPAAALAAIEQEPEEALRLWGLALAFGALGRQGEADRSLAALESKYADTMAVSIASVYADRRQFDRAFAWLDRAYRQRDGQLPLIKATPGIKNLEPDPRYKALLQKLNLPFQAL